MYNAALVSFFVVGNIIGSGFFLMPSILAPIGLNLISAWGLSFCIAFLFAFIFGGLYEKFPDKKALSEYFKKDHNRKTIAFLYWVSCIVGNAGLLIVISANLGFNFLISGCFLIILFTLLNGFFDTKVVEKSEIFLTVLKFGILVLMPLLFVILKPSMFTMPDFLGSKSEVLSIGVSSFWAFLGLETAGVFGSGKSAKRGLIFGVVACALLYVMTSLIIVGSVDKNVLANSSIPFGDFSRAFFSNDSLLPIVRLIISITGMGALHGWIATTAKFALECAKSGTFPSIFKAKLKSGVSKAGLYISSALTFLVFLSVSHLQVQEQFNFIADLTVFSIFLIFTSCAYCLYRDCDSLFNKVISVLGIISIACSSYFFNWKILLFASLYSLLVFIYFKLRANE
jgi:basic amino acid/polyamine antiporter, APA family